MKDNLSTNCKLFVGDIEETGFFLSRGLITVSWMDYSLSRTRDEGGRPFGHSFASMTLLITLGAKLDAKVFFERMKNNSSHNYTLFIDPKEESGRITAYTSAMVVGGYIVSAEESYSVDSRTMLKLELEIRDVKYLGKNETRKLMVFHS